MRRLLLFLGLAVACARLCAQAPADSVSNAASQTVTMHFGYFSQKAVMEDMPEYITAQQNLQELRSQYEEELKQAEDEFNGKYEQFLEVIDDLAPSIRMKRQADLQDLMQKNAAFKKRAIQLLDEAETEAMNPIRDKIAEAVKRVGRSRGLAFIVDTDATAMPYISDSYGVDVTAAIKAML